MLVTESALYEAVRAAWKQAHADVPLRSTGAHAYPGKIFQAVKQRLDSAIPNVFQDRHLRTALFSDRMRTSMDAWDYLTGVAAKKLGVARTPDTAVYTHAMRRADAKLGTAG
jgi:hypothetical protein